MLQCYPAMTEGHMPDLWRPAAGHTTENDDTASLDNESTATTSASGELSDSDRDSALSDCDAESTCTAPEIHYVEENGRTYHDPYKYPLPNDEREKNRMDMLHRQCQISNDERLVLCPKESYARVLDIGTGTGIWAIDFAEAHPEASVIGVDLSPIQPHMVPQNLEFQTDDVEEEWTWSGHFDFIHGRMLGGCFTNPADIFKKAFEHLKPGGYFEVADVLYTPKCDDGTLQATSQLLEWADRLNEAANQIGRRIDLASRYEQMLATAGFEDIAVIEKKWPTNDWADDHTLKNLGRWNFATLNEGLEAISMAAFTHGLGWNRENVLIQCAHVREELKNRQIRAYFPFITAYGKKP